jgi:hypothetical protein
LNDGPVPAKIAPGGQSRLAAPALRISKGARPLMATEFSGSLPSLNTDAFNPDLVTAAALPSPILAPVIALVLWTFVMWVWLYATRIPAIGKAKIPLDPNRTPSEFSAQLPPRVRWKADNYNHLMEQPTLFYATALTLALVGSGSGLSAQLAWAYVALRIVHSLVQALVNVILVRFTIFSIASLVLLAMAIQAALVVFKTPLPF